MSRAKSSNKSDSNHGRSREWMLAMAETQLDGVRKGEEILDKILFNGIALTDEDAKEEFYPGIEDMVDNHVPNIQRDFRHLLLMLHHYDNPEKYPAIVDCMNYLLALTGRGKKYLEFRIDEKMDPDITTRIESYLGYYWKNQDLVTYRLFDDHAEIVQLSFVCIKDEDRRIFEDKGYWMSLKNGHIYMTRRLQPFDVAKHIRPGNSEFDVLQPERMFVYPGKLNRRIRWREAKRRTITPDDISAVLNHAEHHYTEMANAMKEFFRDPLAEQSPAVLIGLHQAFVNGDQLVLQDEYGGLLTVMDAPNDRYPTTTLFRSILPADPKGYALLVKVNNETDTGLFSVKPLSVIAPDRIIRLLF